MLTGSASCILNGPNKATSPSGPLSLTLISSLTFRLTFHCFRAKTQPVNTNKSSSVIVTGVDDMANFICLD
ncbi:hypothetical protein [Salmonella bongori]|uniref:Uncharacterized protein n=3 Tax=Salmonella TaxID=590 RepID=A0A750KIC6_SALER|nr:hypothetical protein [Salmonella bongori]EGS1129439.1 hypothetical protein [Salmonella bongori CFSAN000509]AGR60050.1 hypothetical protein A464_2865 [Salmonella bongori N268-08]ECG9252091.1 hypothetical protein [Salmonella bongori]EDP8563223.1 hypothetical protein [Salmonella bongori]EDP8573880.1 hypothetical protein [Salmonella bongori]